MLIKHVKKIKMFFFEALLAERTLEGGEIFPEYSDVHFLVCGADQGQARRGARHCG